MEAPNFLKTTIDYPGFSGSVGKLAMVFRKKAQEYMFKRDEFVRNKDFRTVVKYNAKVDSLRSIEDRIASADSVDAVYAILKEKNIRFQENKLTNDDVYKLGGKSRKTRKTKKGKTRKGKTRKGKTRRRR
uniref:Uncharacterized protein n=1 Tax=viral metagenome TaxID=1070528 RepID=A0A6C0LP16_9ZZZZ